jgi:hypothetical protein
MLIPIELLAGMKNVAMLIQSENGRGLGGIIMKKKGAGGSSSDTKKNIND